MKFLNNIEIKHYSGLEFRISEQITSFATVCYEFNPNNSSHVHPDRLSFDIR